MNNIWTTGRISLGLGWADLIFGIWLVISPFALGFSHVAAGLANNVAVGAALIVLTLGSTRNGLLRVPIVLLGIWLYASSVLLGVSNAFFCNNLVLAPLVIIAMVASESPYPPNYRPDSK